MRVGGWIIGFMAIAGLGLLSPQNATAQQTLPQGTIQSSILVIEPERLFSETQFGMRLEAEIEKTGSDIAIENRAIESELTVEEQSLTDQRATLPADEFRTLADIFDEKVQSLRREQDAKARALGVKTEEARREFFDQIRPVLAEVMVRSGAFVILEQRSVFLSADAIDVTDFVISLVDQNMGDGTLNATEDD
jgi:Skp family chaperone for outer membrane proteins